MTDVQRIISDLEQQRDAIERAIAALREISASAAPAPQNLQDNRRQQSGA